MCCDRCVGYSDGRRPTRIRMLYVTLVVQTYFRHHVEMRRLASRPRGFRYRVGQFDKGQARLAVVHLADLVDLRRPDAVVAAGSLAINFIGPVLANFGTRSFDFFGSRFVTAGSHSESSLTQVSRCHGHNANSEFVSCNVHMMNHAIVSVTRVLPVFPNSFEFPHGTGNPPLTIGVGLIRCE